MNNVKYQAPSIAAGFTVGMLAALAFGFVSWQFFVTIVAFAIINGIALSWRDNVVTNRIIDLVSGHEAAKKLS